MEKVLVNSDKYNGQYVAMKSVDDNTIVGAGKTPNEALEEARKKGIQNPLLLYVPDRDVINIYYAY
jgi:NADPH-dependent glutamate synthase beta subunit-like oxidoreductase